MEVLEKKVKIKPGNKKLNISGEEREQHLLILGRPTCAPMTIGIMNNEEQGKICKKLPHGHR